MLNKKPTKQDKYHSGLFKPINSKKLMKVNQYGGVIYRSSWEKRIFTYLDQSSNIIQWMSEGIEIPYFLVESKDGDYHKSPHRYYPDIYYELKREDGSVSKVVAEIKPYKETIRPVSPKNPTAKSLQNFEYAVKMYVKNLAKWESAIEWCKSKGYVFIIITEQSFNFK